MASIMGASFRGMHVKELGMSISDIDGVRKCLEISKGRGVVEGATIVEIFGEGKKDYGGE